MKKIFSFGCFILLYGIGSFAQNFSKLGELSKEEIELKQCYFDREASAVILIHEAFSNYDGQSRLITNHHIRIKILNENGLGSANVKILFYRKDNFEEIDKVEGLTLNIGAGGEIVKDKLEKKSIYKKDINERVGEVVFAFPAVKAGSIIDYNYRSTMKHYGGLEEWYFQDELPVVSSKYLLTLLPNTEFAYRANKRSDRTMLIRPEPAKGTVYFEMADIPGLGEEPYMDARKDYIQKVVFQLSGYSGGYDKKEYMTSWDALNTELLSDDDFGDQLKKDIDAPGLIYRVQTLSQEEKMKAVYNYVRDNMNWNGLYSIYSTGGVQNAWGKKNGTSGDINLLLVDLLMQAGLDAYPLLVSERFHGKVNPSYPFLDQFNSVFACVLIDGKKYYMDATDKACPVQITPYDILNTTGFIIKGKTGELVQISNDSLLFKENINAVLEIREDGSVKGSLKVKSEDYARMEKLWSYKKDRDKFKNTYFASESLPIAITGFTIKNEVNDSLPLEQEFDFNSSLNSTGEYKYIALNFLSGFKRNPFLSDNRFSNINFGYRKKISFITNIKLHDSYIVDDYPKSVEMITPDKNIAFRRQVNYDKANNSITCTINIEFKKSLYTADEYYTLKDVYKKIFDYLKEPVLLKKK